MNDELTRRTSSANRIAAAYAANPNVCAVLLAGSVARGTADAFSDIEIDIYWNQAPNDHERLAPIATLGLAPLYIEADEHEWADGFVLGGIKVDTSQFRVSTIDRWIADVAARADLAVSASMPERRPSTADDITVCREPALFDPPIPQMAALGDRTHAG